MDEVETRIAARTRERTRRARRRRAVVTVVLGSLLAGGVGVVLGIRSRTTAEEVLAEQQADRRPDRVDISREVNRTLLELWKMEDLEAIRR